MKKRLISLVLVLFLFINYVPYCNLNAASAEIISFSVIYGQTDARKMAEMTNKFRNDNGKGDLTYDYNLEKVAMQRAAEIAVKYNSDGDSHTRPDGQSYKQTLADFGFDISPRGTLYGENILFGTLDSMELDGAFARLCSDEGNRTQMLGYYTMFGIGHIKIEDGTDFWVQVFANKGTAGDYTAPLDGEEMVSVRLDPSYVTDIQIEYKSGEQTVSAGNTVAVPVYIPKIKVLGSEMEDALILSPLVFESEDGFVRASNGTMTGLREGSGSISAFLLGRTFSYNVTVTAGSGYVPPAPTQAVVTSTPEPTQTIITSTPEPTQTVITSAPSPTQAVITLTPNPTQAAVTSTPNPTQIVTTTPNPSPIDAGTTKLKKGDMFADGRLRYKVTSANTLAVIGLSPKGGTSITIPETVSLGGVKYKVVKIAANAFKGEKKIKSVTIGKNVKTIGKSAFYGCNKLKTITFLGSSVKSIGKNAYSKINSKAVINVSSSSYKTYKKLLEKSGCKATLKKA